MENWSDDPIPNFRIKVFLDTNLLVFLVDETYPTLTEAIRFFGDTPFVDLVSSEFVIYEFFGVRKREHFLREVIERQGNKNISSLLKFRENFSIGDINYDTIKEDVRNKINEEIDLITSDFGIIYSEHTFHEKLLKPTMDICLSSGISKEDSLVLVSAIFPNENYFDSKADHTMVLSKDETFCKAFNQNSEIDTEFENHSLEKPIVQHISSIQDSSGNTLNLTRNEKQNAVNQGLTNKILNIINERNKPFHLGSTFTPKSPTVPNDVICFKLKQGVPIKNNQYYVTIISNSLNFIYTTKHPVDFWHNGSSIDSDFQNKEEDSNISFKVTVSDNEQEEPIYEAIISQLKSPGNLVFIHPDSSF